MKHAASDAASPLTVQSITVAVRVLEALAQGRRSMRITDLAESLGETKARVHRHLVTLRQLGLIEQDAHTERYRLGWKLFQLGEAAGSQFDLKERALPHLVRLRDTLRQTALLSVPVNGVPLVVASADNIYSRICLTVKPGNRPAAHCSAQGRIALAWASDDVVDRMLAAPLERVTPRSVTDPRATRERLPLIRARLYDYAQGENMVGTNSLMAPVFREGGELAGIIGVIGPANELPAPPKAAHVAAIHACAAALTRELNGDAYDRLVTPIAARRRRSPTRGRPAKLTAHATAKGGVE